MYLTPEYEDMIKLFNKHDVKYLVVGSYAMSAWGYSRSTYDIDLFIDRSNDNAQKVYKALDDFGIPLELDVSDLTKENSIIQIGVAPVRIDILTSIDGVDFDDAWQTKQMHDFGDIQANIISLEKIIENKKSTNRAKDKSDVYELEKLARVRTSKP